MRPADTENFGPVGSNSPQRIPPEERVKLLERQLREYERVEAVLVAAGVVSKSKIDAAHDLVQTLHLATS